MTKQAIVCGNTETIVSGYTSDELSHVNEEAAIEFVETAVRSLEAAGFEVTVEHNFRDWNGGKFSPHQAKQYGYDFCGLVCVPHREDESLRDAAFAAENAGIEAMRQCFDAEAVAE
ncbi:hypothetical protein [Botrimarina mediterranea]|uniref:hypothetical protein n=1 Tax=Botrimarina mediterranea TaxID=2528022 RepID=UPI00118B29B9|nr:hypothetical protein K2D_17050 [Planctomycetes bacterium K2D]